MDDGVAHLIIIGAMKSATTSLHKTLLENPAICANKKKELNYLTDGKPVEDYINMFPVVPGQTRYTLDSSPNYTKFPRSKSRGKARVAKKVAALERPVKLVYMMRHPLDRADSHIRHNVKRGREKAKRYNFDHIATTSAYARQLAVFEDHIDRKDLFLGSFDDFVNRPEPFMEDLYAFLGLPAFKHTFAGSRVSSSPKDPVLRTRDRRRMARRLLKDMDRLHRDYAFAPAKEWHDDLEGMIDEWRKRKAARKNVNDAA